MQAVGHQTITEFLRYQFASRGFQSFDAFGKWLEVSQPTAWQWLSQGRNPSEESLRKIANKTEVDITEIRRMAGRAPGTPEPFDLPPEAAQLSPSQRDAVRHLVSEFLKVSRTDQVAC